MKGIRLSVKATLVAVGLLAAGGACGQLGGGGGGGGAPRGGAAGAGGPDSSHLPQTKPLNRPEATAPVTLQSTVQYRLELLEEDLRIRPEQQKAWANYRDRVLKMADDAQRSTRNALTGEMSAPQRLDRLGDIARDRLTAIEDIVEAGKQLYAVLAPGQQGVADRRLAVPAMALVGVEPSSTAARAGAPAKAP